MSTSKPNTTKGPSGNTSVSINEESQSLELNETEQSIDGFSSHHTTINPKINSIPAALEMETIPTSSGQTKTNTNTFMNDTGPSCMALFKNELFYSRIIILLITSFLFILSLCYTLGQILTLHLTNFWCPERTIEEIRASSIARGRNEGISGSCWRTNLNTVNHLFLCTLHCIRTHMVHYIYNKRLMERNYGQQRIHLSHHGVCKGTNSNSRVSFFSPSHYLY